MEKIKIKSLVSHKVLINDTDKRIKRTWDKKGAIRAISLEDLEELVYDPGVEYMFREGMLDIVAPNKEEIMIKLGFQQEGEKPEIIILSEEEMLKLMRETTSVSAFRKKINELPREQLRELINFCVDKELVSYEKVTILKEKTGNDIIKMIELKKADKEKTPKEGSNEVNTRSV